MKILSVILPMPIALLLLASNLSAQENLQVAPETYQPSPAQTSAPEQSSGLRLSSGNTALRGSTPERPMSMTLGEPSAEELKPLSEQSGQTKTFQVGIERTVPELPTVADWVWTAVTGGQAGHFLLQSAGATRVRALLQLNQVLPDGVEVRVYVPDSPENTYGPYINADFNAQPELGKGKLWTPSLSGDSLGIEVFVPTGIDTAQVQLQVPLLSHIVYDLQSSTLKAAGLSSLKFASCDISLACADQEWQQTGKSVARYIYTNSSGSSFLCTGTLIADQDTASQIPYFLTAAHCINEPVSAGNMDFFWFHQESNCGADDVSWVQTSGGAELLATEDALDASLVRLIEPPPAGVVLSGWELAPFTANDTVYGLHHSRGNPKQYSRGRFSRRIRIESAASGYMTMPDDKGSFNQVIWDQGVTAPGGSGSALWKKMAGVHYLKGTLVGGSSGCTTLDAPDEYTRFEQFYPYVSAWLSAPQFVLKGILDETAVPVALVDAVLIARYMDGVRGNALLAGVSTQTIDMITLESRLALAQQKLDIDADGQLEASKDGVLLARYLLGLRGAPLIDGTDLKNSVRNNEGDILKYLESLQIN